MDDVLRNGYILGKGAGAAVVFTRNAKHSAVVAKVNFSVKAIVAGATGNGGIERYADAFGESLNRCAQDRGYPRGLVGP